jgi:5-formyltetrahydrofolate cyclo-ligase
MAQPFKNQLRKEFKTRFAQLEKKEEFTAKLIEHLAGFLQAQSGDWCVYQALDSEISINQLLPKVPNVTWIYPKVMEGTLRFFEPKLGFEKAYQGIQEPILDQAREVSLQEISGFLVPGLGFDEKGVRLGKGKGYYDRALQNFPGETIGISFSSLIVSELPADPWDVKMKWLATEKGVLKVGN